MGYFKSFINPALSWEDVPFSEELRKEFDKFNQQYKQLRNTDDNYFVWCNDLLRHNYNKPFYSTWIILPEELVDWAEQLKEKLNNFIDHGKELAKQEVQLPKWNPDLSYEENNILLNNASIASYDDFIHLTFKFKDTENMNAEFEVYYGDIKAEQLPYFSTSASNKYNGGQAQNALLPKDSILREFWLKWGYYHLQTLTKEEYKELVSDIEILENNLKSSKLKW